jgi:hypothetical protein
MKKKTDRIKKNISSYINFRIIIIGTATAVMYAWLSPSSFFIVHSEELQKNNIQKNDNVVSNNFNVTEYRLKTKIQYCKEDKKNKQDSLLCGQSIQLNEQEELAYKEQARPAEVQSKIQPQMQKPISTTPKIIIRKPIAPRISCAEKNDHPSRSDTKGKHQDEDCCPDPDEWPKPGCVYSPSGRALMLNGPKK